MEELNVKEIRERLGFTQSQLATRIGVDTRTVQNWESHRTPVPVAKKKSLSSLASESHQNNVHGDNNVTVNSSSALDKAIDEIAEQRKLVANSQEQVNRLLSIIEKMTDK